MINALDAFPRIMCWPHFPDGVTGQWSANTFYDENVVPYILAAPAEALIRELVAVLMDVSDFCDGRADADCDQDGYIPNAEMTLGQTVDTVLNRAAALGYGPEGDV